MARRRPAQAGRYLDAVRNMRVEQLVHRPRRLVPLRVLAARTAAPDRVAFRPLAGGRFVPSAPQSGPVPPPHEQGTFHAVGHRRRFGGAGFWTDDADGLLFLFTLHGFTELARYAAGPRTSGGDAFWIRVLESWMADCGAPARPAWHPYPTSERLLSWASALSAPGWPTTLTGRLAATMLRQARVLARSVEHDIGGNHVLRNAAALTVAGACLDRPGLQRRGVALFERELPRQVLSDGGHEERSPSYHRALLEELADVIAVLERAGTTVPAVLLATRDAMAAWQAALVGPDGALPLLNDAWQGPPLPRPSQADPVTDLGATGYVVLRDGDDHAVLDVAPVAPAHLPAHAHADVLSFVLWVDGRLVVADPGTLAYAGPMRARLRGTAAHATVQVDGRDQCDLWGPFRAAGMPRIARRPVERHGDVVVVRAAHDGYRRLPDPVEHERTWCWIPGNGLVIVDRLRGRGRHAVSSRLPLAPGLARDAEGRVGSLHVGALDGRTAVEERPALHSPYLGVSEPTVALVQERDGVAGDTPFGWALLRAPASVAIDVDGEAVTLRLPDGASIRL